MLRSEDTPPTSPSFQFAVLGRILLDRGQMYRNSLSLTSAGSENPVHFFHANGGPLNFPCMLGLTASSVSVAPLISMALEEAATWLESSVARLCLSKGRCQVDHML